MSKWELSLSLLFLIVSINKLGWLLHHLSIPPPSWNNKVANGKTIQLPLVYRYEPPPLHLKQRGQLPECWGRVPAVGEGPPARVVARGRGAQPLSSMTWRRGSQEMLPSSHPHLLSVSLSGWTQGWLKPRGQRESSLAQWFIAVSLLAQNRASPGASGEPNGDYPESSGYFLFYSLGMWVCTETKSGENTHLWFEHWISSAYRK